MTDEEKAKGARQRAHELLGLPWSESVHAGEVSWTRGKCDRLTVYILNRDETEALLTVALGVAQGERDEARAWVSDLQSGMYVNCVYCGHRYGPDPGTPVAMADVLKAHVEKCPAHPLSAALAELKELRERVQEQPAQWFDAGMSWAENAAMQVLTEMSSFNNLPSDAAATGAGKVHDLIFKERKRRRVPREAGE